MLNVKSFAQNPLSSQDEPTQMLHDEISVSMFCYSDVSLCNTREVCALCSSDAVAVGLLQLITVITGFYSQKCDFCLSVMYALWLNGES